MEANALSPKRMWMENIGRVICDSGTLKEVKMSRWVVVNRDESEMGRKKNSPLSLTHMISLNHLSLPLFQSTLLLWDNLTASPISIPGINIYRRKHPLRSQTLPSVSHHSIHTFDYISLTLSRSLHLSHTLNFVPFLSLWLSFSLILSLSLSFYLK